jgi:hypothetical protein
MLHAEWEYEGLLCVAKPREGAIWECPIIAPLRLPTDPAIAAVPDAAAGQPSSASSPAAPLHALPQGAAAPGTASSSSVKQQQAPVAAASEQQQQQQLEVERAMSGCLGLCGDWLAGSKDGSTAEAASSPDVQQQQQQQRGPPTHVFSVSCGVCPAIYWWAPCGR